MSNIDYEITVSVNSLTEEEKKRVQDAFFKLGFVWYEGTNYSYLDKGCYTNATWLGEVAQELMWANANTEPTHSIDQLLELAGMKTNTKPFDLEKALKGEPVVLRDGTKAYIRHHETEFATGFYTADSLMGYRVKGGKADILWWTECGHFYADKGESELDIISMWSKPPAFDHWDLLVEGVKYLAKDGDGEWYGYYAKPVQKYKTWVGAGWKNATILNPTLFPDCDWENSLIERPEK